MNLSGITDDCLERIAGGESVADCLARYPDAAEQLAPVLLAAEQLAAFSQARLTEGQRLRAKAALREELANQRARPERARGASGILGWARLRVAPLAGLVAVVLFATVAFTAVAASQPGDFVYPVRVAAERAPALVQPNPGAQAGAELAAADRRLSDLASDVGRHAVAIDAILSSDQAAVQRAASATDEERNEVSERVAAHAEVLERLADQDRDPEVVGRLHRAAAAALVMAGRPKPPVATPDPPKANPARHAVVVTPTELPVTVFFEPTTWPETPTPRWKPLVSTGPEPSDYEGWPTQTPEVQPARGGLSSGGGIGGSIPAGGQGPKAWVTPAAKPVKPTRSVHPAQSQKDSKTPAPPGKRP